MFLIGTARKILGARVWSVTALVTVWSGTLGCEGFSFAAPARKTATKKPVAQKPTKPSTKPRERSSTKPVAPLPTFYGQQIVIPAEAGRELILVVEDAARTLQKMTGKAFATSAIATDASAAPRDGGVTATAIATPNAIAPPAVVAAIPAQAIVLLRSTAPQVSADIKAQLKEKGREPFVIRGDAEVLQIVANGDDGLRHGLYFYLDQLGCRWYLPNENWTIVPSRTDIALRVNRLVAPAFRARSFFGTGGFGRARADRWVDIEDKLPQMWQQWQRRNGFGGEFRLGGHAGEIFNLNNRKVLEAHPEYLAEIDGKFQSWSLGTKPNVSNPDLVKLYLEDRLKKFRSQRATDTDGSNSFAVSVEPSDGYGHSNSGPSLKIGDGSPADQVFFLANATAQAVAAEFPGGNVNLLAYNQHASPPSFPIEPNVYVSLAPYAFQRTGLSGDEMVELWGRTVPKFGIYDYWAMPDWSGDLPLFDFKRTPRQKLSFWRANGADSFSAESTYSGGAMGLAWYLSSKLMWNPDADIDALLAEFYRDAFGPAAPPMKRMLERWSDGFLFTEHELGLSFRDLKEARALAGNDAIARRLDDYGLYLHYLRLRFEMLQTAPKTPERTEAALRMLRYIWSIYHTGMVHTFRLTMLTINGVDPQTRAGEIYKMSDKNALGWQLAPAPTRAEIAGFVDEGGAKYQPLDFEARKFSGALVPLGNLEAPATTANAPEIFLLTLVNFEIQTPKGLTQMPLAISTEHAVRVILRDLNGKKLWEQQAKMFPKAQAGKTWDEIAVPIPHAGRYRLEFFSQKLAFRLRAPQGVHLAMGAFSGVRRAVPGLYFYVPRGLSKLAVYIGPSASARVFNSAGQEQTPLNTSSGLVLFDVPAGQDGQVWSMTDVVSPITQEVRPLNAPSGFAFSPESLLVPQDAMNAK